MKNQISNGIVKGSPEGSSDSEFRSSILSDPIEISWWLGMPQDFSLEWKSDSQIIFSDENPYTHALLCGLSDVTRFF